MTKVITLGKNAHSKDAFTLPIDFATESCAIIARKGAGKTHLARVLAEDLVEHVPVVIFDPLDVFWGLRLSKDGKKEGCNFVIFGGSHGDLPLVEGAGKHFADLIVDRGISAVFAVDHLSLAAQRRFVADFGERLFERKSEPAHRTAVHLIIDEADSFAPQKVQPDMARCCGVVDRLVRRGRSRGIGTTCISQRPAVLNKDVLTQSEVLICLQLTAPQDKDAMNDWVKSNSDRPKASQFMDSLPHLERGRAWVWSPSRLKVFEQVDIRDTRTYDSSYTPKVGERRGPTPKLTPVDFQAINEQMAAVIKEAEANDPTALKKRVRTLEQELKVREKEAEAIKKIAAPDPDVIAKALAQQEKNMRFRINQDWVSALDKARRLLYEQAHQIITEAISGVVVDAIPEDQPGQATAHASGLTYPKTFREAPTPPRPTSRPPSRGPLGDNGDVKTSKAERLIMTALAQQSSGCTKAKVAAIAGYAVNGGGFLNALGALKSRESITVGNDGLLWITHSGKMELGPYEELPTGPELLRHWCSKLPKAERSILLAFEKTGNDMMTKEEIATAAGYEVKGGGFLNALGHLRTLELIQGRNEIMLSEELQP